MTRIPNALEMRALKYGDRSEAERDAVAEALMAQGRRSEAILLYEGRPDHPFLEEERRQAVAEGRVFHLLSLRRLRKEIPPGDLRAAAGHAEAAGRWLEARLAWQALDEEDEIRRIAEHLPEPLRPEPPPEGGDGEDAPAQD